MNTENPTRTDLLAIPRSTEGYRVVRAGKDSYRGKVLLGRYRLNSVLAKGGMGTIYIARGLRDSKRYAVKMINQELCFNRKVRERFYQESSARLRISHPAVVEVIERGETTDGGLFLVMEYIDGPSLRKFLAGEPLDIVRSTMFGAAIAEGLDAAHNQSVIHRDLKPENILVPRSSKDLSLVKIVDFGLARITGAPRITTTSHAIGTPAYMAPEQSLEQKCTLKSDIYSYGAILFEMITGKRPALDHTQEALDVSGAERFSASLKKKLKAFSLPALMEHMILSCLETNPEKRPSSMGEIIRVLQSI